MFSKFTIVLAAVLAVASASTALADSGKRKGYKVYRAPVTVTEGRNAATVSPGPGNAYFDRNTIGGAGHHPGETNGF
jgi:hypothetical protein